MSLRSWALNKLSGGDFGRQMRNLREAEDFFLERAKEDAGWRLMGTQQDRRVAPADEVRTWARWAFNGGDPFIKRAVWSATEFCFGNGIDGPRVARVRDDEGRVTGEHPAAQLLDEFWRDPGNQAALFSTIRQYERSNDLIVDGELFLLVYPEKDPVQVRRLGPTLVKTIISDPEDASRPLYYVIEYKEKVWDATSGTFTETGEPKKKYYPALALESDVDDRVGENITAETDARVLHVPLNRIGDALFGTSEAAASLRWFLATKRLAEDQATISRATAALAIRLAVTGSETDVQAIADRFRPDSTEAGEDARHHAAPLPGAANITNEAVKLEVNRATSQASDAFTNTRITRMPGAIGMGYPLHYLGDPENANLATSKSMEAPVLKHLECYQAVWVYIYRTLCDFVLREAGHDPLEVQYDIPVPQMIEPDVPGTAKAICEGYAEALLTQEQAASRMLSLLGFDDIEEEVEKLLEETGADEEAEEGAMAKVLAGVAAGLSQEEEPGGDGDEFE